MSNGEYEIILRDDGIYILQTEEYRFHLDEKTHVEKIARLINENKQLKMENNSLKLLVQNWEALDEEKDGQLDKQNQALKKLKNENEKLKKGMIEVVDKYIRNVEHNPSSSTKTYLKVKGALDNVREGLRDLLEDLE